MPLSPIVQFLSVLTLGIGLLAIWKGGVGERVGAAIILTNLVLQAAADYFLPAAILPILRLVADGLTAFSLLFVTIYFASFWLGGAMLLYAAQFTLHSFYFVTNRPNDLFHATVNNANFLGISICLALGTLISWRQRVKARHASSLLDSGGTSPRSDA